MQNVKRLARGLYAILNGDVNTYAGNICRSTILVSVTGKAGIGFLGSMPCAVTGVPVYPLHVASKIAPERDPVILKHLACCGIGG